MKKELIVLFVEGDTDQIFFKALVDYYRKHSKQEIAMCDVVNLKGVTRYTSKLTGKIKKNICLRLKLEILSSLDLRQWIGRKYKAPNLLKGKNAYERN